MQSSRKCQNSACGPGYLLMKSLFTETSAILLAPHDDDADTVK